MIEIGRFELGETEARIWVRQGLALLFLSLPAFLFLPLIAGKGLNWFFYWYTIPLNLVITAVLFLIHELLHGLIIFLCGAAPNFAYGVKAGVPYLATTTGSYLKRGQYVKVALAPFVVITVICAVLIYIFPRVTLLLSLPLAVHTSGAIGDISIFKLVMKYPRDSLIKDELTGFRVLR